MDIQQSVFYQEHLKSCSKALGRREFCYGIHHEQHFHEDIIRDAAQDVYNRLAGHGLSYGAIFLILDIVQSQLKSETYKKPL